MITDPEELRRGNEASQASAPDRSSDLVRMGEILDLASVAVILREYGSDRILYWNSGAEALYGWNSAEALGQVTHALLQTEFPTSQQAVDESLRTSGYWTGELVHTGRDGQRLVVASQHIVRRDTSGQPVAILELNTDLTYRKELEQDLSDSEDRFRLLVDNVQDYAIFLLSPDGRVLSWNTAAQRLKGWSRDEIIGQSFTRFYTAEDLEQHLPTKLLAEAEATGRAHHEGWRVRKDGTRFWADVVLTALRDRRGRLRGFAKITRDLTQAREAEAARETASREAGMRAAAEVAQDEIRASRDQLAAILAGVTDGVIAYDPSGAIPYANSAAARLCGYTEVDALIAAGQASLLECFEAFDDAGNPLPVERLPYRIALQGQTPNETMMRIRIRATGEDRWWIVNATPVRDQAGSVIMVVSIYRDVTELRRSENAARFLSEVNLELSRSLDYQSTLRRVADLAVPGLADSCVVEMTDARSAAGSVAREDPDRVGSDLESFAPLPIHAASVAEVRRSGKSLLRPTLVVVPLVARGEVIGTMSLVVDESGRRFGPYDLALAEALAIRVGFALDNARLYRESREQTAMQVTLNAALTDATARMRTALESRDEFLASVSHDLKNPVAAIKGISQLVQRRIRRPVAIDRERLLEDLEHIDEVANRTVMQIDELLDVSRMRTDHPLDLDRSPTDIVALVRRAVGEHQQQTDRHILSIDSDVAELVGDWDQMRLSRALDQLLENAIKYSPNGGAVDVAIKQRSASGGSVEISIADRGIGIPSEETDRIFGRFERGSNATDRIAGTGLGLAGTRYIVESHGGTISAHNRPGGGARFVIQLPLTSAPQSWGAESPPAESNS